MVWKRWGDPLHVKFSSKNGFKHSDKTKTKISLANKGKKHSEELDESVKTNIKKMINKLSIKEIISLINKNNYISKKKIYDYCVKLKNEN